MSTGLSCSAPSLVKVSTYTVTAPAMYLYYCSVLLGALEDGTIVDVTANGENEWTKTINR